MIDYLASLFPGYFFNGFLAAFGIYWLSAAVALAVKAVAALIEN